ncbi:MAG: matrixin family metalloprotease [Oscillospiraceae bacterium]|jgi:hypothetical protein|nr:matrixin family metalloprotease [Oscillospiraceae bacterium]
MRIKRLLGLLMLMSVLLSLGIPVMVYGYSASGYSIASNTTIEFTMNANFSSLSKAHFLDGVLEWNAKAGRTKNILGRSGSSHHLTQYPQDDGNNYVYRVDMGSNVYAGNTKRYYIGSYITSADININMYLNWANSAQIGCLDTGSVFWHELGHAAGLSESYANGAVMFYQMPVNTVRRTLAQDDINGIQWIY